MMAILTTLTNRRNRRIRRRRRETSRTLTAKVIAVTVNREWEFRSKRYKCEKIKIKLIKKKFSFQSIYYLTHSFFTFSLTYLIAIFLSLSHSSSRWKFLPSEKENFISFHFNSSLRVCCFFLYFLL